MKYTEAYWMFWQLEIEAPKLLKARAATATPTPQPASAPTRRPRVKGLDRAKSAWTQFHRLRAQPRG